MLLYSRSTLRVPLDIAPCRCYLNRSEIRRRGLVDSDPDYRKRLVDEKPRTVSVELTSEWLPEIFDESRCRRFPSVTGDRI